MSLLSFFTVISLHTVLWKWSTGPLLVVLLFHLQMQRTHAAWFGVASMDNFQVLHIHTYVQLVMMSVSIATYLNGVLLAFERVLDHGKPLQFTIWACMYEDVYCSESRTLQTFRLVLSREIFKHRTGVLDWRLFVIPIAGSTVVETDRYYTTICIFLRVCRSPLTSKLWSLGILLSGYYEPNPLLCHT